jgi:hypothetical protein
MLRLRANASKEAAVGLDVNGVKLITGRALHVILLWIFRSRLDRIVHPAFQTSILGLQQVDLDLFPTRPAGEADHPVDCLFFSFSHQKSFGSCKQHRFASALNGMDVSVVK